MTLCQAVRILSECVCVCIFTTQKGTLLLLLLQPLLTTCQWTIHPLNSTELNWTANEGGAKMSFSLLRVRSYSFIHSTSSRCAHYEQEGGGGEAVDTRKEEKDNAE